VEGKVTETAFFAEEVRTCPFIWTLGDYLDVLFVVASVVEVGFVQEVLGVGLWGFF